MATPADKVFKMMSFQYKPLEKHFLNFLKEEGLDDLVKKYKTCSSAKKIRILDLHATHLGL